MFDRRKRRRREAGRAIAAVMAAQPYRQFYIYDLRQEAHVRSGRVYPVMWDWLERGWVEDGWEVLPPDSKRKDRRRHYTLTAAGRGRLAALHGDPD